jgi:hypothetical protein
MLPVTIVHAQQQVLNGAWTVDLNATIQKMDDAHRVRYDSMPQQVKENFHSAFQGRQFNFNSNDEVVIVIPGGGGSTETKGNWVYQAEGSKLTITIRQQARQYEVVWETEHHITLQYMNTPAGAMLTALCLTRNH